MAALVYSLLLLLNGCMLIEAAEDSAQCDGDDKTASVSLLQSNFEVMKAAELEVDTKYLIKSRGGLPDPVMKDFMKNDGTPLDSDSLQHATAIDKPNPGVSGTEMSAKRQKDLEKDAADAKAIDESLPTRANNPLDEFSESDEFEKTPTHLAKASAPLHALRRGPGADVLKDWAWPKSDTHSTHSLAEKTAAKNFLENSLGDATEATATNDALKRAVSDKEASDAIFMMEAYLRQHKEQKERHRKAEPVAKAR